MSDKSNIEWTDATWNPITGCTKVSAGCANCYAEKFAERWRGISGHPYKQGFDLKIWRERLELPKLWKEPRRVFVNSMSDLFHEKVEDEYILEVINTMFLANQHVYQVLTKRSKRLVEFYNKYFCNENESHKYPNKLVWPSHIWIGVSVENQLNISRANDLIKIDSPIKFLSIEPLLGPIEFTSSTLREIQWVIVGGESGPKARAMNPIWVRDIKEQCIKYEVPFFFKQWGTFNSKGKRVGKKIAGRFLDRKKWNEMPVLVS